MGLGDMLGKAGGALGGQDKIMDMIGESGLCLSVEDVIEKIKEQLG
ncbi:hypothetical protein JQU17_11090 [Ponticoccus sp. SC2-23]|nr:hypothetical protein [Alexandriicola marinus]MBM1221437.1 hypothetical protein [Ponticoccus sp. SC6-9]MBM1226478.1 hypothetical protein [Ponticoccus sp. SC6-15]MBM1230429.1 hypothetical protein [Ponticoccus sp. SC6-38]MBM1234952.1 hypothetical protein [Ponticoccus sp. SC6-45]MBM1239450.1 hypothetical protein [Ponticoccus sp. SC6-49]MBM1243232.1 hypothetical protein [Ponticoccus sp. SC2-64]MBM1248476.1 hypothetical protein [Ponticoccus sp. SC6-42]MBM1253061.1 hypothetical protein [Pontico